MKRSRLKSCGKTWRCLLWALHKRSAGFFFAAEINPTPCFSFFLLGLLLLFARRFLHENTFPALHTTTNKRHSHSKECAEHCNISASALIPHTHTLYDCEGESCCLSCQTYAVHSSIFLKNGAERLIFFLNPTNTKMDSQQQLLPPPDRVISRGAMTAVDNEHKVRVTHENEAPPQFDKQLHRQQRQRDSTTEAPQPEAVQHPSPPPPRSSSFHAARRTLVESINTSIFSTSSFFSSSSSTTTPLMSNAVVALDRCVNASRKAPLPSSIQEVIDISQRQNTHATFAPSVREQNTWLVSQLQQRLQKVQREHVVAKIMMLTHDLLVYGSRDFASALAPVAESYFDPDSLFAAVNDFRTKSGGATVANSSSSTSAAAAAAQEQKSYSGVCGDPNVYEHATRYFIAYVHALLQFQLRHRSVDNFLDPDSPDVSLRIVNNIDEFWTPSMRDTTLSCMVLAKFLIAANVAVPCDCAVFAEIMRRYIADSKRLYYVTCRSVQLKFATWNTTSVTPVAEIRKNMHCVKQYGRLTLHLNDFYDSLRALPESAGVDISTIPDRFREFPAHMKEKGAKKLALLEAIDAIKIDSLESVLLSTTVAVDTACGGGALSSSVKTSTATALTSSLGEGSGGHTPLSAPSQKNEGHVPGSEVRPPPPPSDVQLPQHEREGTVTKFTDLPKDPLPALVAILEEERDDVESFATAQSFMAEQIASVERCGFERVLRSSSDDSGGNSSENKKGRVDLAPLIPLHDDANGVLAPDRAAPSVQDRFRVMLHQVLGKGGFGIVYKAWDEEEGRHVACKEVKLGDEAAVEELDREYRLLTTLEHPNIVKVLGFVVHQGHGRIFMEWVPSGSVQSVLQETKRGLRETIVRRYVQEALQGLAYLHSRGIVHRDVKPGNMLLGSDGSVKLTDFGTSRTLGHSEETVQTGTVVGTVPYLAPECVRGTYSTASDVWALGCTALHMITGRTPWVDEVRDNVALIFRLGNIAVASQLILPQALENAEMSVEFRAFITSALTVNRHERPTARHLLHDFFH